MSKYLISMESKIVPKVNTRHRQIRTKIPAPGTSEAIKDLCKIESRSMHGQLPIVWNKAENFSVYDLAGNKWIDFTSTIFVANVGHSNQHVTNAIKKTLTDPLYSCYSYANNLRINYIKKLLNFAGKPFEKAFLLSAGTEATEAALKLMRMYGQKKKKRKLGIICIENNWHGRTLGAQLMSSNISQSAWIGFKDENIHYLPFPYPWVCEHKDSLKVLNEGLIELSSKGLDLNKDVCGFMLETFQGWGAVFYPKDFVKEIENICRKNDILLTFDEMQGGFGRTGQRFGYNHYDVKPDLLCVGKGMGGGVPLSGVIGKADIMDLPEVGNMSSTHSANPLVCAAGNAVLEELESKDLIKKSKYLGKIFKKELEKIKLLFPQNISWILGEGMIMAILFKKVKTGNPDSETASKVSEKCMQKGLLVVHTGRESIKFGPPLTITEEALLEGIETLKESISEVINN